MIKKRKFLVLFIVILGISWIFVKINHNPMESSTYLMPKIKNIELFSEVNYNNIVYTLEEQTCQKKYVGKKLNDYELYQILGIQENCAIALKMDDKYYVAINLEYTPKNYGLFVKDISLKTNILLQNIYLTIQGQQQMYTLNSKDFYKIIDILCNISQDSTICNQIEISKQLENSHEQIIFDVDMQALGISNHSIMIYDTGYLTTNLVYSEKVFYIGKEQYYLIKDLLYY